MVGAGLVGLSGADRAGVVGSAVVVCTLSTGMSMLVVEGGVVVVEMLGGSGGSDPATNVAFVPKAAGGPTRAASVPTVAGLDAEEGSTLAMWPDAVEAGTMERLAVVGGNAGC